MLPLIEIAPAKLNLGLKILRRRQDGYHDIVSVLQTVDLCDRLAFTSAATGETLVRCDHPDVPAGPENLVFRAVEVLRRETGVNRGVRVDLDKRIPTGAGLGGGSSNAGATLRALDRLWGLRLGPERLSGLGAELGSDVPFFLTGGTAVATGRGERLRPVVWEDEFWYVLVYPGFPVSTARAYRNVRIGLTETEAYGTFLDFAEKSGGICADRLFDCLENDFLPVVEAAGKGVTRILAALAGGGAVACSVSGSGSTLFGVFRDARLASAAVVRVQGRGRRVFLCRYRPRCGS
ncbi:MAG: 4-(cytidine 5'-diphospho)-2-C-methyl-D-erythritol kinase [Gemmatimonadota bacterium]|nr:4-(cytidine 5'-diphospho)-2-C-methyl-D-erythritol kinase [Gemmatimonadota bacterium]